MTADAVSWGRLFLPSVCKNPNEIDGTMLSGQCAFAGPLPRDYPLLLVPFLAFIVNDVCQRCSASLGAGMFHPPPGLAGMSTLLLALPLCVFRVFSAHCEAGGKRVPISPLPGAPSRLWCIYGAHCDPPASPHASPYMMIHLGAFSYARLGGPCWSARPAQTHAHAPPLMNE